MSLLMDALKKAEQEKKEAAKRLEETKDKVLPDTDAEGHVPDTAGEHTIAGAFPESEGGTIELSLAPLEQADKAHAGAEPSTESMPASEEPTLNRFKDELEGMGEPAPEQAAEPAQEEHPTPPSTPKAADLTFHGVDIGEAAAESALFEETVQGEPFQAGDAGRSYEETLPGVPAAQLARDIGGQDVPTPVAAQTVFTATQTTGGTSLGFKSTLIGLCVFLVVATSVWYYYNVTPVTPDVPSPWVARGIESGVPVPGSAKAPSTAPPTAPPQAATTQEPAAGPAPAPAVAESAGSGVPAPKVEAAPGAVAEAPQPADQNGPATARKPSPEPVPATAAAETAPPGASEAAAPEATATPAAALPARIEPPPSAIRISHSRGPSQTGVAVKKAFEAYRVGNYDGARSGYLQVLHDQPDDVDAMLGMAAVAIKGGNPAGAAQWYARVLSVAPRNEFAMAGLIALQRAGAPEQSESAVKVMLHDDPDNPFLYFILGNIYASEQRWADAQQAFFDAYRNDSSNADYAMNLAVSLDRLGQKETALDYYSVALKLADQGTASFDPSVVLARIEALKGNSGP